MLEDYLIKAAIKKAVTDVAEAKDRIFFEYLTARGLLHDYDEWCAVLNKDPERMDKLVFGDHNVK